MPYALAGSILFLGGTFFLWQYITDYHMHFPLLYVALIIQSMASLHALISFFVYLIISRRKQ